MQLADLNEIGR